MKKILVGFDGSKGSEQALNRAMMLLDDYGILYLLAVIPGSDKAFVDDNMYKTMKKKAQNLINGVIADIGSHSFEVEGMIEEGDPAAIIIDMANRLNVELIVLGSKGQSELGQYLIGSVANKVV